VERPLGHIRAWRKTFDLVVEADSYEDAQRIAQSQVGVALAGERSGCLIYYEKIHEVEGDREGTRVVEPDWETWYYPSRATMVATSPTFDRAVEAFASLDGSVTYGGADGEILFNATDDSPPEEGTTLAEWARNSR
jgi:hypothetical protein